MARTPSTGLLRQPGGFVYGPWLTNAMHRPWFLNWGKAFQPPFLHWSLLVGPTIGTGSASDDVKVSSSLFSPQSTPTTDIPRSWKLPFVVWIVAVYAARCAPTDSGGQPNNGSDCCLVPVIVVVPEVIVNVAPKIGSGPENRRTPGRFRHTDRWRFRWRCTTPRWSSQTSP